MRRSPPGLRSSTYERGSTARSIVVARPLLERVLGEDAEVLAHLPGKALEGVRYEAPFEYIKGEDFGPLGHSVLLGDFVTTDRRHRSRPHRARLRRGRLPSRRAVRDDAAEPGPARRHLRRADPRLPGQDGLRAQPRDRRGAARERTPVSPRGVRTLLSALLALRHAVALLREVELVHPHDRGPRADAGRERDDRLAPRPRQARALRQVAGGQRRLGALARALLGHAAAGVGVPVGRLRGGVLRRLGRRPARARRRASRRSAPPLHRRRHASLPEVRGRDAACRGGDRRLVRLGRDAVRAVPLPVRERG